MAHAQQNDRNEYIPDVEVKSDSSQEQHYVFLSGKISAQVKKEFLPVSSFDGSRLRFDGSSRTEKPTPRLTCSMIPVVAISNLYAEVSDLEFSFRSNAESMRTMWALNEMNAEQMRFEAGTDFENRSAAGTTITPEGATVVIADITEGDKAVIALDDLTSDQIDDRIRGEGLMGMADTIRGSCSIVTDRDIENSYGAIVLSFREENAQKRMQGIRRSVVRVVPVGDIDSGISKSLKFSCNFPERQIADSKLDFFLFDGKGQHVATNLSRAIKEITTEQLEKFKELEQLEAAKGSQENS